MSRNLQSEFELTGQPTLEANGDGTMFLMFPCVGAGGGGVRRDVVLKCPAIHALSVATSLSGLGEKAKEVVKRHRDECDAALKVAK